MKRLVEKYRRIAKGAPSGVAVSILVHVGIGFGAAAAYITVKQIEPPTVFVPGPQREPTRMDLPRAKPPVEKNTKPSPSRELITVPDTLASQESFQLPDTLTQMEGGFKYSAITWDLPDFRRMGNNLMGDDINDGFGFAGTFYDFKRGRSGRECIMDPQQFVDAVARFVRSGWKTSELSEYYRSPKTLYASCFMIPPVKSSVAPEAFDEPDTIGACWLAHYKGQLVYPEDITIRFRGQGDDILMVRVGGKEVLVASWPGGSWATQETLTSAASGWQSSSSESRLYNLGNNGAVVGDWITLKGGEALDMEVLLGEVPGGMFCSMLTVEVQGEDYSKNRQQAPILPMFKTSEPSRDLKDSIYEWLTYDHAAVVGGPVFRDITTEGQSNRLAKVELKEAPVEVLQTMDKNPARLWTIEGKNREAEFISLMGDKVVLKSAKGKQFKVPMVSLSGEDLEYVALVNPPELKISFTKQSSQRIIETTPFLTEDPPKLLDYTFGAKLKQVSARPYSHPLFVELYVLGQQRIDDRKFVLLDYQSGSFIPSQEKQRSYVFKGSPVELMSYDRDQPFGKKYSDYLVVIRDARGEIIQHSASANWLFPNLDNLRKLKVGNFMDKSCARVYPTGPGPKSLYY